MRYSLTIGKYDIEFSNTSLHKWSHFMVHKHGYGDYYSTNIQRLVAGLKDGFAHIVFGPLTLLIEDWTNERYAICACCGSSEIGEVSAGDEGWTVCQDCRAVEQGYKYVNKREYEAA